MANMNMVKLLADFITKNKWALLLVGTLVFYKFTEDEVKTILVDILTALVKAGAKCS